MGSSGKVWHGPIIEGIEEEILKWPSYSHYMFDKLEGECADRIVLTDIELSKQYTGRQLKDKIMHVAHALVDKYKLQPGATVFINYMNSGRMTIFSLAIIVCGAAIACVYSEDTYSELLHYAQTMGIDFLFCFDKNLIWAEYLTRDLGTKVEGIGLNSALLDELLSYDYQSSIISRSLPVKCTDLSKSIAIMGITSGTTGKPKAVPVSHRNCIGYSIMIAQEMPRDSTFICVSHLDYVSSRMLIFGGFSCGYNTVIMDGFKVVPFLKVVEKLKVTVIYAGSNSFYNLITSPHLDEYNISSVEMVFPVGAKISYVNELSKFLLRYPNIKNVRFAYGSSEVMFAALNTMTSEEYLNKHEDSVKLVPAMNSKVVDPLTGSMMGPNERGLLLVKGPSVFPGYYDKRRFAQGNDSNSSTTPFDLSVFDEENFFMTGDLAYFDDEERLHFVGRECEVMVCRGSRRVMPSELEEIMREHPAVHNVCVIPFPHKLERDIYCPRAFIVVKENYHTDDIEQLKLGEIDDPKSIALSEKLDSVSLIYTGHNKLSSLPFERRRLISKNLMDFMSTRVGWDKQLTGGVVVLDEILTTRTGKVDKNYLRSLDIEKIEIYGDQTASG